MRTSARFFVYIADNKIWRKDEKKKKLTKIYMKIINNYVDVGIFHRQCY